MDTLERKQKLQTLPWYALHEIAKKMCIDEKEINGKEKSVIISKILSYGGLSDEEIEQYVNDYIYGDHWIMINGLLKFQEYFVRHVILMRFRIVQNAEKN